MASLKPPDRYPIGLPIGQADLEYAARKMSGGKDVVIDCVRIETFDLLNDDDRKRCADVEKEMLNKIYLGIITVTADKTDVMQRSDGSTTWMRLLRWVEYRMQD